MALQPTIRIIAFCLTSVLGHALRQRDYTKVFLLKGNGLSPGIDSDGSYTVDSRGLSSVIKNSRAVMEMDDPTVGTLKSASSGWRDG